MSLSRGRPSLRLLLAFVAVAITPGCVALPAHRDLQQAHEALALERERLAEEVRRLELERDSLEEQYLEAQESYEDERVTRERLASNLQQVQAQADDLDADLGAERIAHLQAAQALAAREAELAAIQSTYDELVGDLEAEVSSGQIEIERLREGLRLNVSDDVLFASGSAELDAIGRDVLVKVAGQLKSLDDFIEVRGHTDDRRIRGSLARRYPTNWELAAARAARVVRLLEERGVPGDRLAVVSLGPNDPVVANDSAENRALNRRIEIRLLPRGRPDAAEAKGRGAARAPKAGEGASAAPIAARAPQREAPATSAAPAASAAASAAQGAREAASQGAREGASARAGGDGGDRFRSEAPRPPLERAPES